MEEILFTIKSVSDEGTYYLVNGWQRHKKFWIEPKKATKDMLFKRQSDAKGSLTKLLKVMPEYNSDNLELIEVKIS